MNKQRNGKASQKLPDSEGRDQEFGPNWREHFPSEWAKKYGLWDEKTKTYILPSGTVRQGRRPMFKPFPVKEAHHAAKLAEALRNLRDNLTEPMAQAMEALAAWEAGWNHATTGDLHERTQR